MSGRKPSRPNSWDREVPTVGPLAQLGERRVRNAEVVGSIPMRSTRLSPLRENPAGTAPKLENNAELAVPSG